LVRWLALDIGSRRVGVAICDAEERVVTTLPHVPFAAPPRLAETIAVLVRDRNAAALLVGMPATCHGDSRGERRVAAVVAALRERLTIPVEVEDERGSTAAAQALLSEAGVPRRRWPDLIDGLAARVILESHLARSGRTGLPDTA
jgi:putative Holliday junction resolvase